MALNYLKGIVEGAVIYSEDTGRLSCYKSYSRVNVGDLLHKKDQLRLLKVGC